MKKYTFLFALALACMMACEDPDLDPLQFQNVKVGALISLRGQAYDNINKAVFLGAVDSFSVSTPMAGETFDFDAQYIAKTIDNLDKLEVYARFKQGNRVKVATVEGSTFKVPQGDRYPAGKVSVPLETILTALGKQRTDFAPEDMIRIETDLLLKDGSKVLSSSIVNSSLSEAAFFFPAHSLLYKAGS